MTDRLQQQDDCCIQVFISSSLFLGLTVLYSLPMSPKAELLVADNGRLMNSGRLMTAWFGESPISPRAIVVHVWGSPRGKTDQQQIVSNDLNK